MGGPSSVGFLWGKAEVFESMPVADGGSTMAKSVSLDKFEPKPIPFKYEAGEPAFGEVEAWGPAIDYWTGLGLDAIHDYEQDLTEYALEALRAIDGVQVVGQPRERISVVSFNVQGMKAMDVQKRLDARSIAVRGGNLEAQPYLEALGVEEAVRASFMFYNTREEADWLASSLKEIAARR
jgi:cysteine desulfurase / selenocysteine lyase